MFNELIFYCNIFLKESLFCFFIEVFSFILIILCWLGGTWALGLLQLGVDIGEQVVLDWGFGEVFRGQGDVVGVFENFEEFGNVL